ncbi:MAG: sulfatase [Myxococcota bacterium]|nr:sulfatase [Myxococcota bacterium]
MRKWFDTPWFYFGLAGLLLVAAIASQFRYEIPPKPVGTVEDLAALRERDDLNVIFILVDTLRADHLGMYGYERDTSPRLDEIASRAIRFANVEAQSSWTKASMASLWTGLNPQRTGILSYPDGLPDAAQTATEVLRDAGFHTGGIYRNAWVSENFGFEQGFDLYMKPQPNFDAERFKNRSPSSHPLKGSDLDLTQSAQEFLKTYSDQRFFLYVHYMDAHQYTYDTASDLFGSTYMDIYDNAIHWTDINIGLLIDSVAAYGLADNTIIVIASDHGEGFFEHGFEGHAKGLFQETQRTPWILIPPFDIEGGLVVETQVANIDLWPTVLDLLGVGKLEKAEGLSTLPLMLAESAGESPPAEFADRDVYSHLDRHWGQVNEPPNPWVAVIEHPYRYFEQTLKREHSSLYDHSDDPKETENLIRKRPEVLPRLHEKIVAYLEQEPVWEVSTEEISELELTQLRALGYDIE